ncbi:MAG: LemA family protein [Candidatus Omnitrophota bacterium]
MRSFLAGFVIMLSVVAAVSLSVYRGIVSKRAAVAAKWNRVAVRLQDRNLLIPALEKKVREYADHEEAMFIALSAAGTGWDKASGMEEKIRAALVLDAALAHLLRTADNYSKLQAEPGFIKLKKELSVNEEIVSSERGLFNESVREYNSALKVFPGNLFAARYGYKPFSEYHKTEQKPKTIGRIKL